MKVKLLHVKYLKKKKKAYNIVRTHHTLAMTKNWIKGWVLKTVKATKFWQAAFKQYTEQTLEYE